MPRLDIETALDITGRRLQQLNRDAPIPVQQLIAAVVAATGCSDQSVLPSDYAYNRVNRGASSRARPLFIQVDRGTYRYVGAEYPYTGPIYWKPWGKPERVVGEVRDGRETWTVMREKLIEYPDTAFSVAKQYISWKRDNASVCYIRLRAKEIRIEIVRGTKKLSGASSKGFFTLDDPKQMTTEKLWTWKNGQTGHAYNIVLESIENLPYVMYLLEQKYKSLE